MNPFNKGYFYSPHTFKCKVKSELECTASKGYASVLDNLNLAYSLMPPNVYPSMGSHSGLGLLIVGWAWFV